MVFLLVDPGEFMMGSPAEQTQPLTDVQSFFLKDEQPQHPVRISKAFYFAETPTTVARFRQFARATGYKTDAERRTEGVGGYSMRFRPNRLLAPLTKWLMEWDYVDGATWDNPLPKRQFSLDERDPVTQVSRDDAMEYCQCYDYRLPTEAEYEYAVRAGTHSRYWWGDNPDGGTGNENLQDLSPRDDGSRAVERFVFADGYWALAPVGSFKANPWGFKDACGNVQVWCVDVYTGVLGEHCAYYDDCASHGVVIDPAGPWLTEVSPDYVIRGASWASGPFDARCASRGGTGQSFRSAALGFRCVKSL